MDSQPDGLPQALQWSQQPHRDFIGSADDFLQLARGHLDSETALWDCLPGWSPGASPAARQGSPASASGPCTPSSSLLPQTCSVPSRLSHDSASGVVCPGRCLSDPGRLMSEPACTILGVRVLFSVTCWLMVAVGCSVRPGLSSSSEPQARHWAWALWAMTVFLPAYRSSVQGDLVTGAF